MSLAGLGSLATQLNTLLENLVRTRSWHRWLVEMEVPEFVPADPLRSGTHEMLISALRSNLSRWDPGSFEPPYWLGDALSGGPLTFVGRATATGSLDGLPLGWEILVYADLKLGVSMRDRIVLWVSVDGAPSMEVRVGLPASVERLVEAAESAGFAVTVPTVKWTVVE